MKIKQLALEELKRLWHRSQQLTPLLEEYSPKLHQRFISYVSELTEPFETGMGLEVEKLDDETVQVRLPVRRRTQDSAHRVHTGALVTLAEACIRFFWTRHLDPRITEARLTHLDSLFHREAHGALRARMQMKESERERLLFELRRDRQAQVEINVRIFNESEHVVADLRTTWAMTHTPALAQKPE